MGCLPCLFENRKKCPNFGILIVSIFGLIFSIQNVVSRVSRRKMLPYMASFSYVFDELFIKVSHGPEKILAMHFHLGIVHFTKCSIVNVWQCFKYVSVCLHISTLCNPCHIQRLGIFWARYLLKTLQSADQAYSGPMS